MLPNRIIITVEGAVVQAITADRPGEIEVHVVDFDAEMFEDEGIIERDGDRAKVMKLSVSPQSPKTLRWLDTRTIRLVDDEED